MLCVAVQYVLPSEGSWGNQGRPFSLERPTLTSGTMVPPAPGCHTPATYTQNKTVGCMIRLVLHRQLVFAWMATNMLAILVVVLQCAARHDTLYFHGLNSMDTQYNWTYLE